MLKVRKLTAESYKKQMFEIIFILFYFREISIVKQTLFSSIIQKSLHIPITHFGDEKKVTFFRRFLKKYIFYKFQGGIGEKIFL